ncbi:MAG: ArsR/SmtB family transcription factor, partial [Candidatus Odinarchaeia archaeon]
MSENIQFDDLIYILGNPTRRKILQLLARGKQYPLRLAYQLKVSPRAVTRHLELMEKVGLVEKSSEPSSLGPERTYYMLRKSIALYLCVAPNIYKETMEFLPETVDENYPIVSELNKELTHIKDKPPLEKIKRGLDVLTKIEQQLKILEEQHNLILKMRQKLFQ